ncbi:hypothetical protein [Lapillicoccus sp.]|uniref:hypothetical protein n=1 Tax=Lapillicoccus sp. TaxID=1909287 RepID=UPI00260084B7|nr:hypothetical protein [Lapillicoccus sp.]
MAGDNGFYAPMTYSVLWTVIGVVIMLAIVGWAFVIWWQTRPVPPPKPTPPPPPGWLLGQLKGQYLSRIDEIVRLAEAAELSSRRAHQELSTTVRQFVQEASGLRAPTMTLTELGRSGVAQLEPVTDVVLRLYPVEFGPDREASVATSADVARGVVQRWT